MMEVSGVLMSWLTLVISSVFMRSERICRSTASSMPCPIEFRLSPCFRNGPNSREVSITASVIPAARALPPFSKVRI